MKKLILILILVLLLSGCATSYTATRGNWLDSNAAYLSNSAWFQRYKYGDCGLDLCRVWPGSMADCLIPDELTGPDNGDPEGLYYKHLTPGRVLKAGESLLIGLEDGKCGRMVRSLSVMVHPITELRIVKQVGEQARVAEFYEPFIEGATGMDVELEALTDLYRQALYYCDNGGVGKYLLLRPYFIEVQHWKGLGDCNIHVVRAE